MKAHHTQSPTEERASASEVPGDLIPKYDEHDLAEILYVSVRTVRGWRLNPGSGPEYVKVGDQVRYSLRAILAYIDERTVRRG